MPDPLYVRARTALLDAVEALNAHRHALVLVGAQAIYLQTGDADLAVAEYTTDADFTVAPADLADAPLIAELLGAAGFTPREHPGGWLSPDGIYVDLMVPAQLAGPGTRGARLGPHGKRAARRARGLEGALVVRALRTIAALDPDDSRTVDLWVAAPARSWSPRSTRSPSESATRIGSATRTPSTCSASSAPRTRRPRPTAYAGCDRTTWPEP